MKEQDLNKHIDNIIIKGLIREAQQDDADLEAAIRKISDEDFERIKLRTVGQYDLVLIKEDKDGKQLNSTAKF